MLLLIQLRISIITIILKTQPAPRLTGSNRRSSGSVLLLLLLITRVR